MFSSSCRTHQVSNTSKSLWSSKNVPLLDLIIARNLSPEPANVSYSCPFASSEAGKEMWFLQTRAQCSGEQQQTNCELWYLSTVLSLSYLWNESTQELCPHLWDNWERYYLNRLPVTLSLKTSIVCTWPRTISFIMKGNKLDQIFLVFW